MLWSVLPGSIMVLSCVYMCICSKFMFIGDDGHMRIFCCGKAVTGENLTLFLSQNFPLWEHNQIRILFAQIADLRD